MATVSLTNYDAQLADAQRRQKLAEMLQEQANAPIDVQSYKGVQAAIPWTAVLAKALQSGVAAYQGRKADEQKAAASKQDLASALELANASSSKMPNIQTSMPVRTEQVQGPMAQPVGLQSMAPPVGATNGLVESKEHKLAAALAAQGAPQGAAPTAPNPNLVNMTQDLINKQVPVTPPAATGAMVPPAPALVRPQTISIPDASLYPQSTERTPENQAQIALQGALGGGGPKTTALGSMLYQNAQTQIDEQRKLDLARKEKGLDREEDVNRALSVVNSMPGLTPDQKEFLRFQGKALGTEGLKSSLEQMSKNQFGEHYESASPEQLEGYPKGTVGQVSTTTGKLSSVYNPTSDLNSIAQVKISQANLGINQARLGLERQRVTLEGKKFDLEEALKKNAVLPPEVVEQLAYQGLNGDKSVFQNLGRGQQGAQNIVAIRSAINRIGVASGKTPQEIGNAMADANANYAGITAEKRIEGARSGASTFANVEMPQAVNLSKEAYSNLPRGQFVPFNKLRRLVDKNLSSPEQAIAHTYDEDAIASYARALNPTGIARKSDIERGENLLSGATSIEAHNAVLDAMQRVVTQRQAAGSSLLRPPSGGGAPAGGGASSKVRVYNPVTGRLE